MKEEFHEERRAVARCMRRVYRLRLTSATGGNISCRAGADRFAITPSGIDKARIRAREVGLIDLEGRNLTPELKPSCEWLMHLRIYQRYPSVGAIVHAHPGGHRRGRAGAAGRCQPWFCPERQRAAQRVLGGV